MKFLAAFSALFVLANGLTTREVWPAGKEFTYEYKARVVAGIPAIKQQLTGFGIKSIVELQVVSPDTILCRMTELESGQVNNEVPQAAPMFYRGAPDFHWSPMPKEAEEVLRLPFKIKLRNGLVTNLEVPEDEPTWSVNIKKGLASQLNVNLKQTNRIQFQLTNAKKFEDKTFRHLRTPSSEDRFFAVEEDSMGGMCKTVYVVAPLENYIATREELDLPREILLEAASEPEMRPYMVTKIRDFDECERQPSWVHMNMKDIADGNGINEMPCNPANAMCRKFSTRTSISRFLLRKSPSGHHLRLERVWGENEFVVKPYGVKTERLWSVSNQTLVLLNERPISSRIHLANEKLTNTNLRFEFPVSDPETIENPRMNENEAFQGLRKPEKQTIGETKDNTKGHKKAAAELEHESKYGGGKYGSKYGGGKYGSKYGGGKYGSKEEASKYGGYGYGSKSDRTEEEEEEERESGYGSKRGGGRRHARKYGYGSGVEGEEGSEYEGKEGGYGSKYGSGLEGKESSYGSKYGGGKYGSKYGGGKYGSKNEEAERRSKYERRSRRDTEEEDEEENEEYDNEYSRRDVESAGEQYYETRAMRSEWKRDFRRYYPSLKRACYYLSPMSSARIVRGSNIKSQVEELIREVVKEISNFEDLAEKESALKILQVSRACTVMSYDELMEVYHRLVSSATSQENVRTKKALLLDSFAMAGTHPAIMVIRDLVAKGEVKGELAAQTISTIPLSVKVITPELISELIELVESPQVRPSNQPRGTNQVWITTLLAIGNMINFGCVSPRTKHFNFPKEPRGAPLCNKNDPVIVNEFIPLLRRGLEKSEGKLWKKMVLLHALGNVGHPEVVPVLEACITGEICRDPQVRTKAVNALTRAARIVPSKVYKVLRPVYANQKLHYAIRMASVQTLIYCKPAPAFFTALATDTWFEPSQQVGSFIYSTLENLANNTLPVYLNISRMARMAMPLVKKYKLGAQYSRNIIMSNFIPQDTMGSYLHTTIFGSTKSIIPRFLYTRLISNAGGINLDTLQTGFYAQGVQEVLNKVLRAVSPMENREEIFKTWSRISESWHSGEEPLGALAREMNLKLRKDDPMHIMAWYKLYGGMERLYTADYRSLLELVSDVSPSFSAGKAGFHMKVNYQRAFSAGTVTAILPTDCGIPVFFTKRKPVLMSIRGSIAIEGDMPSLTHKSWIETAEAKIDLRPVVSQNVLIEMGVLSPISMQAYVAGVNTHNLISLPVKANFRLNIPQKKVSFELESPSGPVPRVVSLIHSHQRPFTVVKRLDDFQPINRVPTIKYMHVVNEPHVNVSHVGEELFGIPLRVYTKVDEPFNPMTGHRHRMDKQNFVTALSFLNTPHSLRGFEYRVAVDTARAQTEKIVGHISLSRSSTESPIYSMEPESEYETKHYKRKSEHFATTSEDILNFLKNPSRYYSSEGEEEEDEESLEYSPMVGSSGRLARSQWRSKYSEDEMPEEELEINVKNEGRTTMLHAEIELQGQNPRFIRASVMSSANPSNTLRKISVHLEKEGGQHRTPFKAFVTAVLQYPRLPRTPRREALLRSDMTSLACVTARFGREAESVIKAKVIMARTNKQRRIAENSQAARRCQADEAKGLRLSGNCMEARRQATTLNRYVLDVESSNLPKALVNLTYNLDSYLKHKFYNHLTIDPAARKRNPDNKFRVILNVESPQPNHPYPVVDILTKKPHENANMKTIKVVPWIEAFFPMSAKTPVFTKAINNYLGYKFTPECRVGDEAIQTFDNVTVNYPLPQCYHLIAKDCSRPAGVSVLAKQTAEGKKVVKIVVGSQTVTLAPTGKTSHNRASVVVEINGSPITSMAPHQPHEVKQAGQVLLRIIKKSDGEVRVETPARGLHVESDGINVRVEASNMLRGRICGLCGDFNGEKMAELKGPRGCVHLSPLTFGRSYAVPSEGCSSLPKLQASEIMRHMEKREWRNYERAAEAELTALASRHMDACMPSSYEPEGESVNPSNYRSLVSELEDELFAKTERRSWSSRGGARWEHRSESRPCVRYVTKVVTQGDKTCFSTKPVPECNLSCKPNKMITKAMGFHCRQSSEVNEELMATARFGVIHELIGKESHMSSELSFPDACEMMTV